jgi:arsenical pump membrane protein
MPALRITLLAVAVLGVFFRPRQVPLWAVPAAAAALAVVAGAISFGDAIDALDPLVEPLAFLLAAVPLALLLDRLGFFTAVAHRIDASAHLHLWMWVFAAAVTTLFNLDASVVLLTPLYVRIARRHGFDPVAAAFPPVLLASLASSALPVSNLTNLLAAERFDLGVADFAGRLGPASLAAVVVGYLAYRRTFSLEVVRDAVVEPVDGDALRRGIPIVVFVLVGFTVGDALGIPPWSVALVADVVLVAMTRSVPWRQVPVSAAVLAAALGVLAAAAAPHLGLDHVLGGSGVSGDLRAFGASIVGANMVNNLPALLVAMPALGDEAGSRLWAVLAGVNMGPVLVVTGSLAGLLWLDTARRLGVEVDARRYTSVGLRVGTPAVAAATLALILTRALAS